MMALRSIVKSLGILRDDVSAERISRNFDRVERML